MIDELGKAIRRLARHRGFSAVLIASLAVGIGVCLTVLSAVDGLLFRPPPGIADAERVKRVYVVHRSKPGAPFDLGALASPPTYADLRTAVAAVADLAAYSAYEASARIDDSYRQVGLTFVSDNYFAVLRARPHVGRLLSGAADGDGSVPAALISDRLWRQAFGARADIVGRNLTLNGRAFTIVGVANQGFRGVEERQADVWLTMGSAPAVTHREDWLVDRSSGLMLMVARLRPDARPTSLLSYAETGLAQVNAAFPSPFWTSHIEVADVTAPEAVPVDPQRLRTAAAFSAVSVVVLILICFNSANLLLTAGAGRAREFIVRAALGADRGRLMRWVAGEVITLVGIAGLLGTLLAIWASALLQRLVEGVPPLVADGRLVLEAVAVTAVSAATAGVLPVISASRTDLASSLKEGSSTHRRYRSGRLLVMLGVAGAVLIVICAGLLSKSFLRAGTVDLGFEPAGLIVASVSLAPVMAQSGEEDIAPERASAFYGEVLARIRALPGVESASVSNDGPFIGITASEVTFPDRREGAEARAIVANDRVGVDYFRTMRMRLLRGRTFVPDDFRSLAQSAVVNDAMARAHWPREDPIGRCLAVGSGPTRRCLVVVGVVSSARTMSIRAAPASMFYVPLGLGSYQAAMTLFVRTRDKRTGSVREVREVLSAANGDLSQLNVRAMRTVLEPQLHAWRSAATLFTVGAAVALLVASLGVYGALSYSVARRTREVGIRMAVGATSGAVMRRVVLEGVRTSLVGVAAGCAAAVGAAGLLRPLLYQVHYLDPVIFIAASLTVISVATLASYLPARRAARIDPVVALRAE